MSKQRMIELIREMESADGPAEFTAAHAEALRMNAELASAKWIRADGTVAWDSITNQMALTRWRFLPRAPEAAAVLRAGLERLPNDGPEMNGVSARARLLAALDTWIRGERPAPVVVPVPPPDRDQGGANQP
jgi:hypothetical protein